MGRLSILATVGFVTVLSNFAHAGTGLEGTWKITKTECSSGVPSKGFGDNIDGKVDGTVVFSSNQLDMVMKLKFKYKKEYADQQIKQIQASIAQVEALPDSADKQKSLTEIRNMLTLVNQYVAGVSCQVSESRSYSVQGSTFRTNPITRSSTCPGDESTDNKADDSTFSLSGNTLRVVASDVEKEDNSSCPKGDSTITTFARIK